MKLLVVSHACVTPLNQSFFADVEDATGWSLSLVLPARWRTEYGERQAERWPAFRGGLHPVPVLKSGHIPLHLYRSRFTGLLRSVRPDAIYVQHEPYGAATAQVYLANRLAGQVPIGFYAAQNIAKRYPPPFRWTENLILRNSSFCFPVSGDALNVLRGKGYRGEAEVLPLAVDTEIYRPLPDAAAGLRSSLGITPQEPVIGYLGRLVAEKGLLTLVQALQELASLPWRCVLAGNGPLEDELRVAIASAGMEERFVFPGYVAHTEAPAWLSSFDVLVLPSETQENWKEQFGRVIVEANACGTAVIGTRCGEIPRVLAETGGGLLVAERSPAELAAAIRKLLHAPEERANLAEHGRKAVTRDYDQRQLARRFALAIERALPKRPGASLR